MISSFASKPSLSGRGARPASLLPLAAALALTGALSVQGALANPGQIAATAGVGQVSLLIGQVRVVRKDGQVEALKRGMSVHVGDRVENMGGNSPLFRIVDNRILDLTVSVPPTRLADVQAGQAIERCLQQVDLGFDTQESRAKVAGHWICGPNG